jgi:hypothetical protein
VRIAIAWFRDGEGSDLHRRNHGQPVCEKRLARDDVEERGMGDKDPNDAMTKKMCTQNCVKMGGKYVLYSAAKKTVYELDDQQKPAEFAGQNVKVAGSYDKATKTIHVTSIQAAP